MKINITFDSLDEMLEHISADSIRKALAEAERNRGPVSPVAVNPMSPQAAPSNTTPQTEAHEPPAESWATVKQGQGVEAQKPEPTEKTVCKEPQEPKQEQAVQNQQAQAAQAAASPMVTLPTASPMVTLPTATNGPEPQKVNRLWLRSRLAGLNRLAGTDVAKTLIKTVAGVSRYTEVPDGKLHTLLDAVNETERRLQPKAEGAGQWTQEDWEKFRLEGARKQTVTYHGDEAAKA